MVGAASARVKRRANLMLWRGFCHAHEFIRSSIIEEITTLPPNHALHEHNVRDLTGLLPFLLRSKDWIIAAPNELSRIIAVKDGDPGPVNQLVVSTVVD